MGDKNPKTKQRDQKQKTDQQKKSTDAARAKQDRQSSTVTAKKK